MNAEAQRIIDQLGLVPLPEEGGFFRQTWLSSVQLDQNRRAGSAIYFLMTEYDFSAIHRVETDEIWHYYAGDRVLHVQLDPRSGEVRLTLIGPDVLAGETPQLVVPGGHWQAARPAKEVLPLKGWSLVGCTLAPAWDERGFELGRREDLLERFPHEVELVRSFTR